jgi:ABC-2 type transport system permease protein
VIPSARTTATVRQAAVLARADMSVIYTWKTWLFGWLVRLMAQVVFYSMVGVLVGDPEYTVYVVLGAAVLICVAETMMATASTSWDKNQGTLGLLAASPVEPGLFFFGRSLQWPVSTIVTTSVALLAVPPFFGVTWSPWQVPVLVGIVALTALSGYCMTLLLGSVALVFSEARNVISTIATLYITAFSGAMVPLEYWPAPIRWAAQALPVTHGLEAVRLVEGGGSAVQVLTALGLTVLAGLGWFTAAFFSFRLVFARARAGSGVLD